MIYLDRRQKYLSRSLGVYVQANTGNPTGWRPQYTPLGEMQPLPDWKTAVAVKNAAISHRVRMSAAVAQAKAKHMARVDAMARGQLSGLGFSGGISLAAQMVSGQAYVFHFAYGGFLQLAPGMDGVANAVAADTSFSGPVAQAEDGGIQIAFIYNGQGETVGAAGGRMSGLLNTFSLLGIGTSLNFLGAEGGPPGTPATPTVTPPATPANNGSPASSFFSSLSIPSALGGAAIGATGVLALGALGLVLLLRD